MKVVVVTLNFDRIMLQVTDILERVQRPRISNINVFVFSNQYQIFEEEIQELFDDLGKFNSSIGVRFGYF